MEEQDLDYGKTKNRVGSKIYLILCARYRRKPSRLHHLIHHFHQFHYQYFVLDAYFITIDVIVVNMVRAYRAMTTFAITTTDPAHPPDGMWGRRLAVICQL